jgi:transcription elongation factor Elf1
MLQLAHIAHGKRKFRCPKCGSHRMQEAKVKKDRKKSRSAGGGGGE